MLNCGHLAIVERVRPMMEVGAAGDGCEVAPVKARRVD